MLINVTFVTCQVWPTSFLKKLDNIPRYRKGFIHPVWKSLLQRQRRWRVDTFSSVCAEDINVSEEEVQQSGVILDLPPVLNPPPNMRCVLTD